ncbi:hypothetical protein RI129_006155 [Pyrocoelia pectoralis]|uniref:Gag-like protein n=1 Tax=Pyrocoelia pectoralis TaxID=417401 RepID=A0AAN7ZFY9_9COLE
MATLEKQKGTPTPLNEGGVSGAPKNATMNPEKRILPRFWIVKKEEGDFFKDSPFAIYQQLFGFVGETKMIRKIKEGLLVETASAAQASRLESIKKLGQTPVTVTPHDKLNQSRGVITCRDLLNCTVEEIVEGMSSQNVIEARRIKTRRNGTLEDTASLILTFNKLTIPQKVKAGFHSLPVRLYIPDPIRCFKCQAFGHTTLRCNNAAVCACGKQPHEDVPCNTPFTCVNCKGDHSSRSKNCPTYKTEKAIQEIKTRENLPYHEAKKKVVIATPAQGVSYAETTTSTAKQSAGLYKEVASQLLPLVKEIVQRELEALRSVVMPPPRSRMIETPVVELKSVPIEKRKQSDRTPSPLGEESDSSQSSQKGKRGWPKGKPRKIHKVQDTDVDVNIDVVDQ